MLFKFAFPMSLNCLQNAVAAFCKQVKDIGSSPRTSDTTCRNNPTLSETNRNSGTQTNVARIIIVGTGPFSVSKAINHNIWRIKHHASIF